MIYGPLLKRKIDLSCPLFFFPCDFREASEVMKYKAKDECRFAFRTKTQLEVMDDGYKWRKYGKKMVKNSPNPRYFVFLHFFYLDILFF